MASANHGNTRGRKPSVWNDFHRVNVPGGTRAGALAMCKKCGSTLRASAKKHGTSHLRRHAQSSCCAKRAAARGAPCLSAAAPAGDGDTEEGFAKWLEDLLVEPELDLAGRLVIDGGDELVDAGRDVAAAGDHGRLSPDFIQDPLPQAPTSSSMRFFQKKRERSASQLASHEGGTKDKDNSSLAKDWAPTVDNSMFDDVDFTSGDWE